MYNDRRTVVGDDGTVQTWLQIVPPARAADVGTASTDGLPYLRVVSPQVIRCRQRTITSGATYYVDIRDNSVSKEPSGRNGFFPPPERVAEALARQLCADRPRPQAALLLCGREPPRIQSTQLPMSKPRPRSAAAVGAATSTCD